VRLRSGDETEVGGSRIANSIFTGSADTSSSSSTSSTCTEKALLEDVLITCDRFHLQGEVKQELL
jgi:hypothetical protein